MNVLSGKGFYIWKLQECGGGDPAKIASMAKDANLGHVIIKIADGIGARNISDVTGADLVKPVVIALQKVGVTVWGWQYIYGSDTLREAQVALSRIQQTGVTGFVVNAEKEFKTRVDDRQRAIAYMRALTAGLPKDYPIGLSSYRRPDYHQKFPFVEFLSFCDFNLPQVYWLESHDPADQLKRCTEEYNKLSVVRPMIPTGSSWEQSGWAATSTDINSFLVKAYLSDGVTGANFWSWQHAEQLPELWNAIRNFDWEPDQWEDHTEEFMSIDKIKSLIGEVQKELNKPLR